MENIENREKEIQREIEDIIEKLAEKEKSELVKGLFPGETRYRGENFREIYRRFYGEDKLKNLRESKEGRELDRLFREWAKNKPEYCEKCGLEMKKSDSYLHIKEEGQPAYKGLSKIYYSCMNEQCDDFGKSKESEE